MKTWLGLVAALASIAAAPPPSLTVEDIQQIRQLIEAYGTKVDACTDSGYAYADQYTPNGSFGVSSAWGDPGKSWYNGRDQLAEAVGGGPSGCRPDPWGTGDASFHHVIANVLIEPSAEGAHARSTLLSISNSAPRLKWQGGYEDRLVKTPAGWRFLSRRHVLPGHDWPDTAAEQQAIFKARQGEKE